MFICPKCNFIHANQHPLLAGRALDSSSPLSYDFGHVLLVVDRQHAQALYIMTATAEMGAQILS